MLLHPIGQLDKNNANVKSSSPNRISQFYSCLKNVTKAQLPTVCEQFCMQSELIKELFWDDEG